MLRQLGGALYVAAGSVGLRLAQVATGAPGAFTDQYGRIDWARLGAAAGFCAVVGSVVTALCLPLLRDRLRTVLYGGRAGEATVGALAEAVETYPARWRQAMEKVFPSEIKQRQDAFTLASQAATDARAVRTVIEDAKVLTTLPTMAREVVDLKEAMRELTDTIREENRERSRERLSDREEFAELRSEVRMINTANYQGQDRRHEDRRHGDAR